MGNFLATGRRPPITYTVALDSDCEAATRSKVFRSATHPEELVSSLLEGGIENGYDAFQRGCRVARARPCLGRRKRVVVDGTACTGDFEWWTYGEVEAMAQMLGSGILYLDLVSENHFPEEQYKPAQLMRTIGVCSKNRLEWFALEQAANAYSLTLVPLYDTLGDDAMMHMMTLTRMSCLAASHECITQLFHILGTRERTDNLTNVICFDPPTEEIRHIAHKLNIKIHYWVDLMDLGKDRGFLPLRLPTGDDVATICFTSGTTGYPKGALLTHRMFASTVCGCLRGPFADPELRIDTDDVYMSYLPLAHVLERAIILLVFVKGARVAIYSGEAKTLLDDIKIAQPTVFVSVPRLYMRINDKINASVRENSSFARYLFTTAVDTKVERLRATGNTTHPIWDRLVFNKVRAIMGGRLRYMFSGGAALELGIQERMAVLFCCPFLEGYGLTETMGVTFGRRPREPVFGHVGSPIPCVECCLESVPEMGYDAHEDKGEILIRGPQVSPGYFLNPEATAEAFTPDGWFKSGDIAARLSDVGGRMKIIDRRKNIFKMSQGEYVAAERVESVYGSAPLVSQIYVYGDSMHNSLVAIICLDDEEVHRWLKLRNEKSRPIQDVVQDPKLKLAVKQQLQEAETSLKGFEKVKEFFLEHEQFTVDQELLTPTFKLKRHNLHKKYKDVIHNLYDQLNQSQYS